MQTPVAFKEIEGSDQWKTAAPGDGILKGKWWEIFGDATLNEIEERVSTSNYNVKTLEAQFRESVALIAVSTAPVSGALRKNRGSSTGSVRRAS